MVDSKTSPKICWSGSSFTKPMMFINTNSFVFQHEVGHIKYNHPHKVLIMKITSN